METKGKALLRAFAPEVSRILTQAALAPACLQEIRLRAGCPLLVVYDGREQILGADGRRRQSPAEGYLVSARDVQETLQMLSSYSLYAFEEEVRQGFFTINGGHRVGLAGRTVIDGGTVRGMKYISCINVRLAHQVKGCADRIIPHLIDQREPLSTLIVSPPRCGKTTLLRDLIRQFSDGSSRFPGRTVGVVDERSEIGGCHLGVPQNDVGIRTDLLDCCPKAEGMMMLIRSMAPEIVAVDEIGDVKDADAIASVMNCGCKLLATVHGQSMEDIAAKPLLKHLFRENAFARFVILRRDEGGTLACRVLDPAHTILYQGGM